MELDMIYYDGVDAAGCSGALAFGLELWYGNNYT
jgi:hypothetical protein